MKKKLAGFLAFLCAFSAFSACGGSKDKSESNIYNFESVYDSKEEKTLKSDESAVFTINEDISGKNYIRLKVKTNVQLLGQYTYANADNPSEVGKEDFFIEAPKNGEAEIEFKQFLDTYRPNAVGKYDKILQSISLTNKSGVDGTCTLLDVSVSDRAFPTEGMMVYLEKDSMKIGADLATGGSLSYLERKDHEGETLDEVVDAEGNVEYGVNYKDDCEEFCSSSVNLINIYDAGRQVQQSYYANVGGSTEATKGENGYTRGYCFTGAVDGYYWPYNPVQAGDCADNPGQVVDFEITEDYIYVKARAMDWGKGLAQKWKHMYPVNHNTVEGGVTTKSYMENWYRIEENNLVVVENTFIDWNGFTDMETVPVHTNELPASFFTSSLSTFVYYDGKELKYLSNVASQNTGTTPSIHSHPEDWYAWVNKDNFGVGVYVAGIDYYSISRVHPTSNIASDRNKGAFDAPMVTDPELLSNKPYPASNYTSCYVFNTSYVAPVNMWTMKTYDKMHYNYAIAVDYVPMMRAQFNALAKEERMQNTKFKEWIG